ncbi:MAG: hypothetical protein NC548_44890 [Lachnospiraceae bacterium]|nr:hypothetical protein [Lachnospiraceae bacterium]
MTLQQFEKKVEILFKKFLCSEGKKVDGHRIQQYWSHDMEAMLETYRQFEILIPAKGKRGAAHCGEDGRYVETLIREYLKRYLPKDLEVLTGFIMRPAVKTGLNNKTRKEEKDDNSTQLDILVYDSAKYPIFQRFGDSAIVPPEGVVGVISVKKKLKDTDIESEVTALKNVSKLCRCNNDEHEAIRGPFLALAAMESFKKEEPSTEEWIFEKLSKVYTKEEHFDDLIGYIGSLNQWSIFKKRPRNERNAEYLYFNHKKEELHLGFQFMLTGILSVYYDKSRNNISRPGFTAFPSRRACNRKLGDIVVKGLR